MLIFREGKGCMTIDCTEKLTLDCCHRGFRNFELAELLFDYCSHCGCELTKMSTIGHGAFAACKIRQNNEKMLKKINLMEQEKDQYYSKQCNMELTPMKYNSKLMNSIWGMYNRYSVHNLKKIMDDNAFSAPAELQIQSVSSALSVDKSSTDTKAAKSSSQRLPSFWAPSDLSY